MEQQLIRRVELIMNFNPTTPTHKKSPNKAYFLSAIMQSFSLMSLLLALFCSWQAIKIILNIEVDNIDWSLTAILTGIAFANLLGAPRGLVDFILKRHMMKIIKTKPKFNDNSNNKLRETMRLITDKKTTLQYLFLPVILVTGAILNVLEINPIWDLFVYITPICLIVIILKSVENYKIITKCLASN